MTKQEIQNQIIDAVLDTEDYDLFIIVNAEFKNFADEPSYRQLEIGLSDIENWIEESGLLLKTYDHFNPESGHYQTTELIHIEDFDIDTDTIREYIRTSDKFIIL